MSKGSLSGTCELCDGTFGKAAMGRHMAGCALKSVRQGAKTERYLHLLVEGRWAKRYWLYLAVKPTASLSALDEFLRSTWLECCGHLSAFEIGARRFKDSGMRIQVEKVLRPEMSFTYEYDFGSTTELCLKVVGVIEAEASREPVALLAQNNPLDIPCDVCGGAPAEQICTECQYSGRGWLCQACADAHPCSQDYFLPVVNSPRAGVCGYCG